jgi:hypothetical protein
MCCAVGLGAVHIAQRGIRSRWGIRSASQCAWSLRSSANPGKIGGRFAARLYGSGVASSHAPAFPPRQREPGRSGAGLSSWCAGGESPGRAVGTGARDRAPPALPGVWGGQSGYAALGIFSSCLGVPACAVSWPYGREAHDRGMALRLARRPPGMARPMRPVPSELRSAPSG